MKSPVRLPVRGQFVGRAPDPARQSGQVGRAQRRGLDDFRANHRYAQQIGLELHQQVVGAGAAIDSQFGHAGHRVAAHRVEQRGALEGDRLERGPRDVGDGRAAGQPEDRAFRLGPPIGRAQPGEGRHHDRAARVGHAGGQRLDVR